MTLDVSKRGATLLLVIDYTNAQLSGGDYLLSGAEFYCKGQLAVSDDANAAEDQKAREADRQVNSMQDQRSMEAASWSKDRKERVSEPVIQPSPPVIQPNSVRLTRGSKDTSAASVAAKGGSTGSKPFSMSYDGMTQAEYLRHLIERGSR